MNAAVQSVEVPPVAAAAVWRFVVCFSALVLLVALPGCGGDPPKDAAKPPEKAGEKAADKGAGAAEAAPPVMDGYIVLGENLRWRPIEKIFKNYTKNEVTAIANPTQPNLAIFVIPPPLERKEELLTGPGGEGVVEVKACVGEDCPKIPPLLAEKLDKYVLIILQTGASMPKAVVLDSHNKQHELKRGDRFGSEGGTVLAILQDKMLVSVPGKTKAVVLSIEPPITELESDDSADGDDADAKTKNPDGTEKIDGVKKTEGVKKAEGVKKTDGKRKADDKDKAAGDGK